MSVVINTNSAATMAANNLAASTMALQRSLNRLSSGSKIVSPADDAGGLAVSMKLSATARQQADVQSNISSSVSYLQTQDGVLSTVGKILDRMSQLKTLYQDPTKNSADLANYNDEFVQLQKEITSLSAEKFNGVALFGSSTLSVGVTAASGGSSVVFGGTDLMNSGGGFSPFSDTLANFSNWTDTSSGSSVIATASGGVLTLSATSGVAQANTNQSFSGALEADFQLKTTNNPGENAMVSFGGAAVADFNIGTTISANTWHDVKITVDGSGNYATYLDGSSSAAQSGSIGSAPSGALSFEYITSSGGNVQIQGATGNGSALTVTSTAATGNVSSVANASNLGSVSIDTITAALQDVATFRADNGAQQSRLGFASDVLTTNKANIEQAASRITDVDVAAESTELARYNTLVQAGTSMLSQANQTSQIALKLLG